MEKYRKLGEIEKNLLNTIVVSEQEFRGQRRVDIRLYWAPGADPAKMVPTKKGINLSPDELRELKEILNEIS